MSGMIDAALQYAELGVPVFPLVPGNKFPLKGSHGVNDATTNRFEIIEWWDRNPNYNIGGAMGNGLIALDFDEDETEDKHGLETLRAFEMKYGELPDTWIHSTPRGGEHRIFRDPYGYENKPDLYHDVELISVGHYIVLPPSRRADGKPYEWQCGYSPEEIEIATINDVVRAFLVGDSQNQTTGQSRKSLPGKVYDGEQEIVFMWLVGKLWNLGLSEESIRAVITIENEARFEPSWTDRELETTIFRSLSRGWDVSHPYWKLYGGDTPKWKLLEIINAQSEQIEMLELKLKNLMTSSQKMLTN